MSCVGDTCGTGDWGGPKPGDPDNQLTLTARTVYGGIKVSWSYPLTNPHAVAHTILYRGLSSVFNEAVKQGEVAGSIYFDALQPVEETVYYYWIRMVTINGTTMEPIGPVSATAEVLGVQTLETLTGLIDAGVLSQALKTSIAGITLNNQAIYQEIQDRLAGNTAFQAALAAMQGEVVQALAFVYNETVARTDADSAIVQQMNIIAAVMEENTAAIIEERTVRATKDEAHAAEFVALYAAIESATGSSDIGAITAAITAERDARVSADGALASQITTLATNFGDDIAAAVQEVSEAQATINTATANQITTVESAINGNVATGEVGLRTVVDTVNGRVTQIGALYTAKVEVNGLIGGFGVYNDGHEVQAGFDVDTFWIGRTNENKVKPFIVSGGIVYMDKARIRDADIDTLKIAGEAVTVPIVIEAPDRQRRGVGEGIRNVVNVGYMNMAQAGLAYILCTSAQGFYKNDRYWELCIRVNGVIVRQIMGRQPESAPVLSKSIALPVGVSKVEILWSAHSDVILGYCEIFMMGVKK